MIARSLWSTGHGFEVRPEHVRPPSRHQIVVRVQATVVNPIDAKRASGYGRRLLSLKGAGSLPRVLGNDFAGVVGAVGPDVRAFREGDRVFGVVPTGPRGAHSSHVWVDARWARPAPKEASFESLAVLPYSFTTAWRAIEGIGLDEANARGRRVVILGAGGGLGRLATWLLSSWGADVTAISHASDEQMCLALGARAFVPHDVDWPRQLARRFEASLNFAAWDLDARLTGCLAPSALGQATTVHPLLENFDRNGWSKGALASLRAYRTARADMRRRAPHARYSWTLFAPNEAALDALVAGRPELPIGAAYDLAEAAAAFAHVAAGRPGRAVLLP